MTLIKVRPNAIKYSTYVRPDVCTDGTLAYLAGIPELPGCMSHGSTAKEALLNLEDAKAEYLTLLEEQGLPIPEPDAEPAYTSVSWQSIPAPRQYRAELMTAPGISNPTLALSR
jgi:predicted RNase H-like HicB family nuclease